MKETEFLEMRYTIYLTDFKATFLYSRRQFCIIHNSCFLRPTIPAFSTLTYSLLLEKLNHLQLVKKFPAFYETRKFITAFPKCPSPDPAQSNPYPHIPLPEDISCPSFVVSVYGSISPGVKVCEYFVTKVRFYGEEFLSPKLEDHPLSAVRDFLFNVFAATLHIGSRSSILRTRHALSIIFLVSHLLLSYCCWTCLLPKRCEKSVFYNVMSRFLVTIHHKFGSSFDTDFTLKMDTANPKFL
jgi:hypothetical protein